MFALFDKVEIVQIEHPNHSYKALDAMVETCCKNLKNSVSFRF